MLDERATGPRERRSAILPVLVLGGLAALWEPLNSIIDDTVRDLTVLFFLIFMVLTGLAITALILALRHRVQAREPGWVLNLVVRDLATLEVMFVIAIWLRSITAGQW